MGLDTLRQFGYLRLDRPDRGVVKTYLEKVSGLSRAQLIRLIRVSGHLADWISEGPNAYSQTLSRKFHRWGARLPLMA